jgi:hypothetical protein
MTPLQTRIAIEALRAGVPNRTAVRMLGSTEDTIETSFDDGLTSVWQPGQGLLVAGGFGTGKSHLLGFFRELALEEKFVVSWVTVSKETPLGTPRLVYAAALRSAIAPGHNDDAITAAVAELQRIEGAVKQLELRVGAPGSGLSPVFAAILYLLGRQIEPDLQRAIEAFLAGGKLPGPALRQALARAGARGRFDLRGATETMLLEQRMRFVPELFRAAGFAGWCVLIDEIELIGRYGRLQRARSYAELARWLGVEAGSRVPGLHVTAAITDDFADGVINRREDREKLPELLVLKGQPQLARLATAAMRAIERATLLRPPTDDDLRRHEMTLRKHYGAAYGWTAPALAPGERRADRTMRHHIRGWITQWDMLRLYGSAAAIDVEEHRLTYEPDPELDAEA